jgi:sterol desaturase/sphingolipid hydroxylase (fatty acid hydroxylase superfamily)
MRVIAILVVAVAFCAIEAMWPARPQRRLRPGLVTDLAYWVITPLVSRTLAMVAVVIVALVVASIAGVPLDAEHLRAFARRSTWLAEQPIALQIVLVLAVGDFVGYWMHRFFHRGRAWRFHAVHHSSVELDWLSAVRLHPVNDIVQRAVQAIVLVALGFDTTVVAAYVPALSLYAIMLHANVRWTFGPLRYVLASPAFHRWHHTSGGSAPGSPQEGEHAGRDKNFAGLFPIWDLVFGTFYLPRDRHADAFGVDEHIPTGLLGQLVWPFRS